MTTITDLPAAPARSDLPDVFVSKADAFVAALPGFVTQTNAVASELNAIAAAAAAGYPITMEYTFSTTTTDSDPGSGVLRLNNATQTSATQIYIDLLDSAAVDRTTIIDWLDNSTSSTSKGVLRLYKTSDSTKFLVFNLTAWTTATGYRKLTVTHLFASGTSPVLTDSDAITVAFHPNGDSGTPGGDLNDSSLFNVRTIDFYEVENIATTSGSININWQNGNLFKQTEPTGAITYTFTAPYGPCHVQLHVLSDGVSTAQTFTWPAAVKWLGAQWTAVSNKNAVISFYYDGTNYWAQGQNEV